MGGGAMICGMARLMGAATAGTAAMAPSSSTAFCHASSQDHSNNMSSALNLSQKEASYGSTPSKATADLRLLNAEDLEYSSDEDWGKLSYNRLIFAPAPSEEEVEEATKELHAALHLERPMFGHSRKRHCLKPPIGGLPNIPTTLTKRRCDCYDLYDKCVPYMDAWTWQKSMVKNNIATIQEGNNVNDAVIILQHSPVYTMGTRSSDEYLFFDKEQPPCDFYRTERGGEVTYHGPGQLVMYPILNLRHYQMDLHWYLRSLEEVVIRALRSACAMEASRIEGITGVWVGDEKVAAIGVRVSRWVTYHGLALNVTTDLSPFKRIVPCGISTRPVGSVCEILRRQAPSQTCQDQSNMLFNRTEELLDLLHKTLLHEFSEVFGLELSHACQDISISSASSYI